MKEKKWQKPELVILTRSKPEESVLTFCKASWGAGPGGANQSCQARTTGSCYVCSSGSSS